MRRINELAALPPDTSRYETLRENAEMSKQLYDAHNKIRELEGSHIVVVAEARRLMEEDDGQLKRARKDKRRAEEDKTNSEDGRGRSGTGAHQRRKEIVRQEEREDGQ